MSRRDIRIAKERARRKRRAKRVKFIGFLVVILIIVLGTSAWIFINHNLNKMSTDTDNENNIEETIKEDTNKDIDENKDNDNNADNNIEDNLPECRYEKLSDSERLYKYDSSKDDARYVNILVLGVDGRHGQSKGAAGNSDTMIFASYDNNTGVMDLISIPRDTYVPLDTPIPKINSAYLFGGSKKSIAAVQNLLDTKVDYYVKVNYAVLSSVVDALGGVYVDIPKDMYYEDPGQDLYIDLKAGKNVKLDGKRAEEYIRWRSDGRGDIGRIERQQYFVGKVIERLKSFSTITKVPAILNSITDNVQTNMPTSEIRKYALKFAGLDRDKIKMQTLKGSDQLIYNDYAKKKISYYIVDKNGMKNTKKLFHGNDYIDKKNISIEVANCTNKARLASDYSQFIRTEGYGNISMVDGKEKINETKIVFYGVDEKTAAAIKQEFRISNVEMIPTKSKYTDVQVLLGNDHDYIYKSNRKKYGN